VIVGILPTRRKSQAKFKDKYELPFTLLCDVDKDAANAYGVYKEKNMYGKKVMGIVRTTFIIGRRRQDREDFSQGQGAGTRRAGSGGIVEFFYDHQPDVMPEFDMEMAKTRTAIERVPLDKLTWKPHEKSMTLGRLAAHLAEIPGWGALTINQDTFDIAPPGSPPYSPPVFTTTKQFLDLFDKNVNSMRAALAGATDENLGKPWSLLSGGKNMFTMPGSRCSAT
jgi:hypothetical protein